MKIGIIGFPNTGKKTLFYLLTGYMPKELEISQNKTISGIAEIKDPRFTVLADLYKPKKRTRARIDIDLLPKIEKDSIANGDFFKDISSVDALCHIVREFSDDSIYHVNGTVDPKRDIELVNSELILNDLIFIEKRFERIEKDIRKLNSAVAAKEKEALIRIKNHLDKELPIRIMSFSNEEKKIISGYPFMTAKEMIIVLNVSADNIKNMVYLEGLRNVYKPLGVYIAQVSVKLESEIAGLETEEERNEFLKELGIEERAIDIITRLCLSALNLISFYTVGGDEVRQWTVKSGSTAPAAAGVIHSDLERGFIRAEVMKYDDLIKYGTEQDLKSAGKLYLKGKDYIVEDGDIMSFRFSV